MGIQHKRSGDTCDKCHKQNTVGEMVDYTDPYDGYKALLCSECISKREKSYKEICPKCKRLAYKQGGMSYYGNYPENFEDMCLECVEKKEKEVAKRKARNLSIKNFAKDNWRFWIATILGILALIGVSRLWD